MQIFVNGGDARFRPLEQFRVVLRLFRRERRGAIEDGSGEPQAVERAQIVGLARGKGGGVVFAGHADVGGGAGGEVDVGDEGVGGVVVGVAQHELVGGVERVRGAVGLQAEGGELGPGVAVGGEVGKVVVALRDRLGEAALRLEQRDLPLVGGRVRGVVGQQLDVGARRRVVPPVRLAPQPVREPRARAGPWREPRAHSVRRRQQRVPHAQVRRRVHHLLLDVPVLERVRPQLLHRLRRQHQHQRRPVDARVAQQLQRLARGGVLVHIVVGHQLKQALLGRHRRRAAPALIGVAMLKWRPIISPRALARGSAGVHTRVRSLANSFSASCVFRGEPSQDLSRARDAVPVCDLVARVLKVKRVCVYIPTSSQ